MFIWWRWGPSNDYPCPLFQIRLSNFREEYFWMIICLNKNDSNKWWKNILDKKIQNICQKVPDYDSTDIISTNSGFNWSYFGPLKIFYLQQRWPSLIEFRPIGYDLEWRPSKDYSCQTWFKLAHWFLSKRLKCKKSTTDVQGLQKLS